MATQARNEAQVRAMLMPELKKAVDYVVQKIWNENRDLVRKIVYDAYQPEEYNRTGQFKEAWDNRTEITGNIVTGEFYYDLDKLETYGNHHASVIDGQPIDEYLADVIYEGLSGAIYQEGYAKNSARFKGQAWTRKRNVWNALIKSIKVNKMRKWFEDGLKQQGITYARHKSPIFFVKD